MRHTLQFCLVTAVLFLGLAAPATAQDSWRVVDHSGWPVWATLGYWDIESEGAVKIVVSDGAGGWRAPTRDETEQMVDSLDPKAGKNVGDTVEPGDVIGVIIIDMPPLSDEIIIAIIAAAVGTLAGTAFGAWLYKRLGR